MPSGTLVTAIPDWICEIVSPSNASNDTVKKMRVYHQAKVSHYWLMSPMEQTLQVYRWTQGGFLLVLSAEREEKVRAEPFDGVEMPIGVFFGDDDDD